MNRHYLANARKQVEELLRSGKELTLEQLGVSQADVMRARATEMALNPKQLSMSEMMAMASDAGNNISGGDEKSDGGMKMPVGMPKVGKMPDWVKKRIEARKRRNKRGRNLCYRKYRKKIRNLPKR